MVGRPRIEVDTQFVRRAQQVQKRYEKHSVELERVRAERDELIVEMRRAGYGLDVIARVLDMNKARVQQIVKEAEFRAVATQLMPKRPIVGGHNE